jgi:hypothetical protein
MSPSLSHSVLSVPNRVYVYVDATLKPLSVELWAGPTGTEVAEAYCRLASGKHPISVGNMKGLASPSLVVSSCQRFWNREYTSPAERTLIRCMPVGLNAKNEASDK